MTPNEGYFLRPVTPEERTSQEYVFVRGLADQLGLPNLVEQSRGILQSSESLRQPLISYASDIVTSLAYLASKIPDIRK